MAKLDTNRLQKAILDYGQKLVDEHKETETADTAEQKINSGDYKDMDVKNINAVKTLISMVRDVATKKYKVPLRTLVLAAGGIAYLVSPIDVVPDVIPGGLVDDALVISIVVKSCYADIAEYKKWKDVQDGNDNTESVVDVHTNDNVGSTTSVQLDTYLAKTFGENESLKKAEIERLAGLCYDETVTDVRKRAEIALADLS